MTLRDEQYFSATGVANGSEARSSIRPRPWILRSKIRAVLLLLVVALFATAAWAFWIEPSSLTTKRITVDVPRWPEENTGLRLAILGDLHIGAPYVRLGKLQTIVDQTNDLRPDLIVLLGDYVTGVLGAKKVAPEDIAAG